MRVAALIIGIFGAIAGFIGGLVVLSFSGVGGAFGAEEAGSLAVQGTVAVVMSIVALVGAALSLAHPRVAAVLMLISAIIGVVATSAAYAVATVLLVIAAVFDFIGRKQARTSV